MSLKICKYDLKTIWIFFSRHSHIWFWAAAEKITVIIYVYNYDLKSIWNFLRCSHIWFWAMAENDCSHTPGHLRWGGKRLHNCLGNVKRWKIYKCTNCYMIFFFTISDWNDIQTISLSISWTVDLTINSDPAKLIIDSPAGQY